MNNTPCSKIKELLSNKGFIFNNYDYMTGSFYEYEGESHIADCERVAKLFGFVNKNYIDLLLCCNEDLTHFEAYCDGDSFEFDRDKFIELVEKI